MGEDDSAHLAIFGEVCKMWGKRRRVRDFMLCLRRGGEKVMRGDRGCENYDPSCGFSLLITPAVSLCIGLLQLCLGKKPALIDDIVIPLIG